MRVAAVAVPAAECAQIFEDFGVEDGRADLVNAGGPLAEVDLAAAVRTSSAQVGQRRIFADFFLGAMGLLSRRDAYFDFLTKMPRRRFHLKGQ